MSAVSRTQVQGVSRPMFIRAWWLGKVPSIVARRDTQCSEERTAHLFFVAEAATFSNRLDSVVRFLKPAARRVNSDRFHRLRRGAAALRGIDSCRSRSEHSIGSISIILEGES